MPCLLATLESDNWKIFIFNQAKQYFLIKESVDILQKFPKKNQHSVLETSCQCGQRDIRIRSFGLYCHVKIVNLEKIICESL